LGHIAVLAATLFLGLQADPLAQGPGESFLKALREAKQNQQTPAGQNYDRVLSRYFEQQAGVPMQRCFASTKEPDARSFEMLFRLSKAGKVLDALVRPETNIAVCLRDKLKRQVFPAPPEERFWAYMDMRIGGEGFAAIDGLTRGCTRRRPCEIRRVGNTCCGRRG